MNADQILVAGCWFFSIAALIPLAFLAVLVLAF